MFGLPRSQKKDFGVISKQFIKGERRVLQEFFYGKIVESQKIGHVGGGGWHSLETRGLVS